MCGERKIEAVSIKINDVEMSITDGILESANLTCDALSFSACQNPR